MKILTLTDQKHGARELHHFLPGGIAAIVEAENRIQVYVKHKDQGRMQFERTDENVTALQAFLRDDAPQQPVAKDP